LPGGAAGPSARPGRRRGRCPHRVLLRPLGLPARVRRGAAREPVAAPDHGRGHHARHRCPHLEPGPQRPVRRVSTISDDEHAFRLAGLELGVATAPTQIEGHHRNSNWYDWAERGRIKDNSSPDTAGDHWVRWREDTALLDDLGIRHYRMGLEWGRLEPLQDEYDEATVQRYRDELLELRRFGIRPLVTLHHFSHPTWFESLGGFEHPDGVTYFLRFVRFVVERFGDLVSDWITINEPNVYVTGSYFSGIWPPGAHNWNSVVRVFNRLATAHILAYELIHELQPHATVGVAFHLRTFKPALAWNPWHH